MTNIDTILVDFEELTSDGDRIVSKEEEYYGFIWDFDGSYGGLELTAPGGFSVPQAYSLNQENGSYFAYDQYVGTTEVNLKRSDSSDFYFESGAFAALDVTIFESGFTQIGNNNSDGLQLEFIGLNDGVKVASSGIIELGVTTFRETVTPTLSGFSDVAIDELIIRQAGSSTDVPLSKFVLLYDNLSFTLEPAKPDPITGIMELPGKVNLKKRGKTPFVLYGNEDLVFDTSDQDTLINPDTLGFGSNPGETLFTPATKKNGSTFASYEDVNSDGFLDCVVKVDTPMIASSLEAGEQELVASATTNGGEDLLFSAPNAFLF